VLSGLNQNNNAALEPAKLLVHYVPMKRIRNPAPWLLGAGSMLVLGGTAFYGCSRSSVPAPVPVTAGLPTGAQLKLRTTKLWLGKEEMIAELALTAEQQQTGMMFRTNMAENEGMLFVFGFPHQAGFWMKNTILPLSAAYIAPDGQILELHDFEPHNTNTVLAASANVQFVLETPQGWFKRHNVREGMFVRTDRGTLLETAR
jgi:uncharacterized membrane protein (UPF0127 family)